MASNKLYIVLCYKKKLREIGESGAAKMAINKNRAKTFLNIE